MSIEAQILKDLSDHAKAYNTRTFVLSYDEWNHTIPLGRAEFANVIKELQIMQQIKVETQSLSSVWLITIL